MLLFMKEATKSELKQKFKLSATIIGICFLLHGIPVFAAESSEMIEFDLKTNEMKTVEIEEQNS